MKTIYFIVTDTTKQREDPAQMYFFSGSALNDLCGTMTAVAEKNGTPVSEMRLFVAPDRNTWSRMYNEFTARADWSRWSERADVSAEN